MDHSSGYMVFMFFFSCIYAVDKETDSKYSQKKRSSGYSQDEMWRWEGVLFVCFVLLGSLWLLASDDINVQNNCNSRNSFFFLPWCGSPVSEMFFKSEFIGWCFQLLFCASCLFQKDTNHPKVSGKFFSKFVVSICLSVLPLLFKMVIRVCWWTSRLKVLELALSVYLYFFYFFCTNTK